MKFKTNVLRMITQVHKNKVDIEMFIEEIPWWVN